jgi:hypothetical protein
LAEAGVHARSCTCGSGRPTFMALETCPNCGAEVPARARCCPQCGADEQTGWAEEAATSHLGLPDDSFNYDEYLKREFSGADPRPRGISWLWWVTAVLLLAAALALWLRR